MYDKLERKSTDNQKKRQAMNTKEKPVKTMENHQQANL
ncbi:hypothetical protein C942_04028 [Photobacterium marinum]|uniref:Uncharacterized protein n=1 Tax=Photobacterium marinum TaxID=1056511 RepID=L8J4R9_9GAMM|nr:hypothetical protein C942_04028 [Photobacterium marinum]